MSATNFNLRGIPAEVMAALKQEAKRLGMSVNLLILKFVERSLGMQGERIKPVFHDLDHLAGSWSAEDTKTFKENTRCFEQIDEELWS